MKSLLISFLLILTAKALDNRYLAYQLHNKLVGMPPDTVEMWDELETILNNSPSMEEGIKEASLHIMNNESRFFSITLRNFTLSWTNTAKTNLTDLNDTATTIIGAIRDSGFDPNRPEMEVKKFNRILYEDIVYFFDIELVTDEFLQSQGLEGSLEFWDIPVTNRETIYRAFNNIRFNTVTNDHYTYIDKGIFRHNVLKPESEIVDHWLELMTEKKQSVLYDNEHAQERGIPIIGENINGNKPNRTLMTPILQNGVNGAAGILTTRGWSEQYFSNGTNRRNTFGVLEHFMCKNMLELHDTTQSDIWVAKDVDRVVSGNPKTYQNNCKGCHAGQDALRGATAYYDFYDDMIAFSPGHVVDKMNRNAEIYSEGGYITTDDSWENLWAYGQNAYLGWPSDLTSGNGLSSWGEMFAKSRGFSECMTKKTYEYFCYNTLNEEVKEDLARVTDQFHDDSNFKDLIANVNAYCLGRQYEE